VPLQVWIDHRIGGEVDVTKDSQGRDVVSLRKADQKRGAKNEEPSPEDKDDEKKDGDNHSNASERGDWGSCSNDDSGEDDEKTDGDNHSNSSEQGDSASSSNDSAEGQSQQSGSGKDPQKQQEDKLSKVSVKGPPKQQRTGRYDKGVSKHKSRKRHKQGGGARAQDAPEDMEEWKRWKRARKEKRRAEQAASEVTSSAAASSDTTGAWPAASPKHQPRTQAPAAATSDAWEKAGQYPARKRIRRNSPTTCRVTLREACSVRRSFSRQQSPPWLRSRRAGRRPQWDDRKLGGGGAYDPEHEVCRRLRFAVEEPADEQVPPRRKGSRPRWDRQPTRAERQHHSPRDQDRGRGMSPRRDRRGSMRNDGWHQRDQGWRNW